VSSPFIAEIRIFPFGFAPTGWAQCDGQLLPISQNTALFSLIGTSFGGNGKSNFGLPNMQGSVPLQWGQGPGLTDRILGEAAGEPTVTLDYTEVPAHTHALQASAHNADLDNPAPTNALARSTPSYIYKQPAGANAPTPLANGNISTAGSSQPHNNLMPYLTLNFCIALQGVYPARS
jgi:microcystin-dependent protein